MFPSLSFGTSNNLIKSANLEQAFILSSMVFVAVLTSVLYLDMSLGIAVSVSDFLVTYQSQTVSRPFAVDLVLSIH